MRFRNIFIILLLLSIIWVGCSRAPKDTSSDALFQIEFGELGGAAGTFTGYKILGSGNVLKLKRNPGSKTEEETTGTLSKEKLNTLFEAVEIYDVTTLKYQKRGNMVYHLKIHKEGKEYIFHWPLGDENVPQGLTKLQTLLNDTIRTL